MRRLVSFSEPGLYCLHAGIAEAYWEYRLKPWDVCAGVLILEEAGGKVTTMDGLPYRCA
jgi:fructose-1,6-bisphosphatase/inositol monophosphatase family enzyme